MTGNHNVHVQLVMEDGHAEATRAASQLAAVAMHFLALSFEHLLDLLLSLSPVGQGASNVCEHIVSCKSGAAPMSRSLAVAGCGLTVHHVADRSAWTRWCICIRVCWRAGGVWTSSSLPTPAFTGSMSRWIAWPSQHGAAAALLFVLSAGTTNPAHSRGRKMPSSFRLS
jgi:hypothetical protein